jgi:hypothetical protein
VVIEEAKEQHDRGQPLNRPEHDADGSQSLQARVMIDLAQHIGLSMLGWCGAEGSGALGPRLPRHSVELLNSRRREALVAKVIGEIRPRIFGGGTSDSEAAQNKAKAKEAALRAKSEERRRKQQDELKRRRTQLEEAQTALRVLEESLSSARENSKRRTSLAHHLGGFYNEVDKLAKGKSMIEATPLIVEEANDIIRDAKEMIKGDVFLDRVKQFVPAGTNPVYPDVLVVARIVQSALERAKAPLEDREKHLHRLCREGRTIAAALTLLIEKGDYPSIDDVRAELDASPIESWFFEADDGESYFNVERLDRVGVQRALAEQE